MIAVAVTHSYGFVGSRLREFKIINKTLDTTTNYVVNAVVNGHTNETVMLEIVILDNDSVDFKYSFYSDKKQISDMSILIDSKRVIGYMIRRSVEIIVVTDGDNMIYSDNKLASFITPTNRTRYFDYIYYSDKYPKLWNLDLVYCPIYWHFKYYNGKIYAKYMMRK